MFICNSYANNNKKSFMTLKQRHLLTDTAVVRADDVVTGTSQLKIMRK